MDITTQSEPNSCQEQSLNKKLYFPPDLKKTKTNMIKIESKLESNKCVKEKKAGDSCPASMPVLHS